MSTTSDVKNAAIPQSPVIAAAEQAKRAVAPEQQYAAAFGHIVTVLMRSAKYRLSFLAELEWLAAPAAASGQFALAERRDPKTGIRTPTGVVMWASVSDEVDRRLSTSATRPQLKPAEWVSGSIPWLMVAVGDPTATATLLRRIVETKFSITGLKTIELGSDGRASVRILKSGDAPARSTLS